MSVIWIDDLRGRLSRLFNLKGEGPPQYLPISNGVQLTYDIGEDAAKASTNTSAQFAKQVIEKSIPNKDVMINHGNIVELGASSMGPLQNERMRIGSDAQTSLPWWPIDRFIWHMSTAWAVACPTRSAVGIWLTLDRGIWAFEGDVTVRSSAGLDSSEAIFIVAGNDSVNPQVTNKLLTFQTNNSIGIVPQTHYVVYEGGNSIGKYRFNGLVAIPDSTYHGVGFMNTHYDPYTIFVGSHWFFSMKKVTDGYPNWPVDRI